MYGTIVGRYRLVMTAVLMIYAAVAVEWLARQLAARRWRAAVPAVLARWPSGYCLPTFCRRRNACSAIAPTSSTSPRAPIYDGGDLARAFDELVSGLETAPTGPDQPTLPPRYDNLLALPFGGRPRARSRPRRGDRARAARGHSSRRRLDRAAARLRLPRRARPGRGGRASLRAGREPGRSVGHPRISRGAPALPVSCRTAWLATAR